MPVSLPTQKVLRTHRGNQSQEVQWSSMEMDPGPKIGIFDWLT